MSEPTDDPSTWPAWLREHNERAELARKEGIKRRREAERDKGDENGV